MYGDFWHDDYEICFDRKVVSAVMSDSVIVSIGYPRVAACLLYE